MLFHLLKLQERILNAGVNNLIHPQENVGLHSLRAESTPPNPTMNPQVNQTPAFNRARCVSEQPQNIQIPSYPNFSSLYQQQASNQTFAQASQLNAASSTSSQQQIFRNNQVINQNNRNIRNMRASTNQTQTNSSFYHHHQQQQQQQHNTEQANTFINLNNHFETNENETNLSNIRQNNRTPSNLTYQNLATSNLNGSALSNHNNINLLNNSTNNENGLASGSIYGTQQANLVRQGTPSGPVQNIQQATPQALNNQVPPGNRANNYWDNFRR